MGRARRDLCWVWSRATLTIENIRERSSVIRRFVALSFVAFKASRCDRHYPGCLSSLRTEIRIYSNFYLKVRQVCLEAIYRGRDVVVVLPNGFMESQSYFNCRRRAALFYSVVIVHVLTVVSPLNVRDQIDGSL